jgi:coproporphyrinogen III oxidase-like Fe-S oxidoreductase
MFGSFVLKSIANTARKALAGPEMPLRFTMAAAFETPSMNSAGIYVHVPFCKRLCPYCPYNRIAFEPELAKAFIPALEKEIVCYAQQFPSIEITSVYFGGGTPTVLDEGLERIVHALRRHFSVKGPLCIETNPADLTPAKVQLLKEWGFDAISLGVQSFNQRLLRLIGRSYSPEEAATSLELLCKAGFPSINIDLMFALPSQTVAELEEDLRLAIALGAQQITAYPLFVFPYSEIGKYRKLKDIEMPSLAIRKRMYYFLYDLLESEGFKRVSVWSFKKESSPVRYSSVIRETYLGFGPSAGSYYGPLFTLNTFSIPEYITAVNNRGDAVALKMNCTPRWEILFDFYWRLYETDVPMERETETLRYKVNDVRHLKLIMNIGKALRMIEASNGTMRLTRRGSFWIHLAQNYFALPAINAIWEQCKKTAWPKEIFF